VQAPANLHGVHPARAIDTQATRTPLLTVLKAATAIPLLYNRCVEVDGRACMDGGLVNPVPIEHALASGCSDLLVLLTRPAPYRSARPGSMNQWIFNVLCARGNPRVSDIFSHQHERSRAVRDLVFGRSPTPHGVNIATICTDSSDVVNRTTLDPALLRAAAKSFGRKTLRAFGAADEAWDLQ
jgi:predicted acylesterase/phospholipase RssA